MRRVLLALPLLALPCLAAAHPGHALAQTAYLTLAPGEVRLELSLVVGEDAVAPLLAALDPDGDGQATEAEARAWAEEVLRQAALTLDGEPVAWVMEAAEVPDLATLATGSAELRVQATAEAPDGEGTHILAFANSYAPAETVRTANVFVEPGEGWTARVTGQERSADGAGLEVSYEVGAE